MLWMWLPALIGTVAVLINTPIVITALRRLKVVDVASERSSHTGVAIRGVGLSVLTGVIAGLLVGIFALDGLSREILLVITVAALLAALLGAVEDFRGLSVRIRAGLQIVIAAIASIGLATFTSTSWLWCIPALIFIAGYINVANFMDGVDGISGIHGLLCGLFYLCLGFLVQTNWLVIVGGIIAGSFVAFLPWNLRRKGTFLGDTGSYLLGALVATTAVATWMSGIHPIAALGPVIIYCVDTGGTLLRRITQGERWYKPHRNHVYQKLTDVGFSHVASSSLVGVFTGVVAGISLLLAPQSGWNNNLVHMLIVGVCIIYWFVPQIVHKSFAKQFAATS